MRNFTEFISLGFLTWRLAHLLVYENGPYDLIGRLRVRLGVRYDAYSKPYGTNVVSEAIACFWCCSMWVGFFIALLSGDVRKAHKLAKLLSIIGMGMSLSAIAILIDKFMSEEVR